MLFCVHIQRQESSVLLRWTQQLLRKFSDVKRGNDNKCLKEDEYALKINPTTCVLSIASNSETASGLYKSYNAEDEEIQECDVQEDREVGGSSAGVVVGVVIFILVIIAGVGLVITEKKRWMCNKYEWGRQ